MTAQQITLLFIGWLCYWLSVSKMARDTNPHTFTPKEFAKVYFFDMILSLLNCLAIVISRNQLSFEVIDLTNTTNLLIAGFTSSVVINHVIQHFQNASRSN